MKLGVCMEHNATFSCHVGLHEKMVHFLMRSLRTSWKVTQMQHPGAAVASWYPNFRCRNYSYVRSPRSLSPSKVPARTDGLPHGLIRQASPSLISTAPRRYLDPTQNTGGARPVAPPPLSWVMCNFCPLREYSQQSGAGWPIA